MRLLRVALANPRIARLEGVWAMAALVKWGLAILVALYAYRLGGATAVGVAGVVRMLPAAILAPRLAVLADRRSRRTVLLWSLVGRLVCAVGLWAGVAAGGDLTLVLLLAACFGVADALQRPTQAALVGLHARNPAELAAANALWSMLDNAAFLVGSLLVGLLVSFAGLTVGFASCVVPLAVGLVVLAGLPADDAPPPLPGVTRRDELLAGIRIVVRSRQLRLLTGVLAADMCVQGVLDVLLVVVAVSLLDAGEAWAGWLSAAWGVGGVLGGAAAAVLLARRRMAAGVVAGLLLAGLPLTLVAVWPEQVLAAGVFVALGLGFGVLEVALLTLTQRLVPSDVLGRVYGAQETVTIVAMGAGSLAAAALVAGLGETGALVVCGLALPLVALIVLGRVGLLDLGAEASDADFALLRAVEPFATLPVATIENLAVRADHVEVPAGEHVVRQGEPGETFFVIESGEVEVVEDGVVRRREGPGDFFGEIALLRGTPRTASVVALTDLDLLALSRREFLAAVEHPRTRLGLDRTADARLHRDDEAPEPQGDST